MHAWVDGLSATMSEMGRDCEYRGARLTREMAKESMDEGFGCKAGQTGDSVRG
jgi:hypothetical protein